MGLQGLPGRDGIDGPEGPMVYQDLIILPNVLILTKVVRITLICFKVFFLFKYENRIICSA